MKNVHILPTDKPSRLYKTGNFLLLDSKAMPNNTLETKNQNIYITNDSEIKVGDWYYLPRTNYIYKCIEDPTGLNLERRLGVAKIILTTDPDLIKDGVQAIDNEFLEWFVKNPSCEFVEVRKYHQRGDVSFKDRYRIIIPQEEPKQELELKDFESSSILDVLNMGNIKYLDNGDIIYNPNLLFIKGDDKWFIKTELPKQETNLDKKSLYIQDYKSRISALQYVIDFYEILTKEDIVKQKDDYSKQLKDLENE